MEYRIDTETGEYPLSVSEIWRRHPNTMMAHHLERYAIIEPTEKPEYDEGTQKAVEVAPLEVDGAWRQQWDIASLTEEELAATAAEKIRQEKEAADAARLTVTKRQCLLALFDLKRIKESDILAAISAIEDEDEQYRTMVDWQGATAIHNDNPATLMLAAALGITEDLPQLFAYAATL